jgi:hypothetical protein
MSSNKNTYDPIAIPCQYSRPSVLGTSLDSLEVQSVLKDSYKQLIVLDSCRSFVSKCPMASIRCRLSNSVTSPVASSFGNVSLRRGSTDNGESYGCPGDLSNRLKQFILFISSDIKKTQKINPASFAITNHDERFIDNTRPIRDQSINYNTSLLNHSGEVLTVVGGISVSSSNVYYLKSTILF